jgi:hypothetical protein
MQDTYNLLVVRSARLHHAHDVSYVWHTGFICLPRMRLHGHVDGFG